MLSLRYAGQSFELDLPVARPRVSKARLARDFDTLHARTYGYQREGHPLELVHARVAVVGALGTPRSERRSRRSRQLSAAARRGSRDVYFDGKQLSALVLDRAKLGSGMRFEGPAVVEEDGSVTVVWPSWRARVDEYDNLVLERS